MTKLVHKKDRDDLIFSVRGDGQLLSINFNAAEKIIGWHNHPSTGTFHDIATITDNSGNPQLFALVEYNSVYYIERQGEYVEFPRRADFLTATNTMSNADKLTAKGNDDDAYIRMIAEKLKECIYLDNSQCVDGLQDNLITYDSGAGTITDTSGVFVAGDVGKFIIYKTQTGYEYGRFEITGYTSANVVSVDEVIAPSGTTSQEWYLTFTTVTGLSRFNGLTVSVVSDGGYEDDYVVSGGEITLTQPTTKACVGYKYTGLMKTFSLGIQIQLENTQPTEKTVTEFYVRTPFTAGGLVGTDLYDMNEIQNWEAGGLINYLPPLPVDGTKLVEVQDSAEKDKYIYVMQDKPLPMIVSAIMINADHVYTKS